MPTEGGNVILDSDGGKPTLDSSSQSGNGTQGGNFETERINGFDAENPATERISSDRASSDAGVKYTKSGRIDRRTLRGRGKSAGDETQESSLRLGEISLKELLIGVHAMGAAILAVPELEIDADESERLSNAVLNVGKYYAMTFDPKKVALLNFAAVCGSIYGVRILAIRNRLKTEAKPKPQKVEPINQPRPQAQSHPVNGASKFRSPAEMFGQESSGTL